MCLLFVPPAQLRHAGWGKMFAWILSRLELATIGRQALLREPEHGDMLRRRPCHVSKRFATISTRFVASKGRVGHCRRLTSNVPAHTALLQLANGSSPLGERRPESRMLTSIRSGPSYTTQRKEYTV